MSAYGLFASYYDALTKNVEYARRAEHFLALLERHGCHPSQLLDLACGTGSLSLCFSQRGMDVIAVDGSAEMLSVARQKAEDAGADILFLQQRMERLDLYGTVEAVICALDSVNHLLSPAAVRRTFERVSLFLEPGGLFAFDANTLYKQERILGDQTFVYDEPGVFCVWQNRWDPRQKRTHIQLDFFEKNGALYRRSQERFAEQAYASDDLEDWLRKAGLEPLGRFGEFSFSPPAVNAERIVYLAKKV